MLGPYPMPSLLLNKVFLGLGFREVQLLTIISILVTYTSSKCPGSLEMNEFERFDVYSQKLLLIFNFPGCLIK